MTKKQFRKGRTTAVLMAVMLAMAGVSGCGSQTGSQSAASAGSSEETESGTEASQTEETDLNKELTGSTVDTEFTDRDKDGSYSEADAAKITLNGTTAEAEGDNVSVSGSTVTISGEGIYLVTGTLENGQIIVDAADTDKVQIVLKDAEIHCETSAAVYVKTADKVFVTLADGSTSKLSGGTQYVDTDDNTVDGVIFSKADLTVNGSGSLEIDADYKHGIVSKDTLAVTGGTITIDAVSQCLSGKDGVKVADGTFFLTTQGKAVKSENTDDTTLGNIYVAGGTFTVKSEDDAFHAGGSMVIDGGTFTVESGDDAFHADQDIVVNGGTLKAVSCYEGLEGYRVTINGGEISITSTDDGVNAADPSSTGDQEAQGGGQGGRPGAIGSGGNVPAGESSTEEGQTPADIPQPPTEAAANETASEGETGSAGTGGAQGGARPEGGAGQGGMGRMGGGGGSMENDANAYIKITGGTLTVDAGGDGLDSNGSLAISGGTVYVSGSEDGGNGSLDYSGEGIITGGTVIAAGSSGMNQGFGDSSAQYSILQNLTGNQEAGSAVTLTDKDGNVLASWTPQKRYSSVVISCPGLEEGGTYTLTAGTESAELTLESVVTSNSASGEGGPGRMGPGSR